MSQLHFQIDYNVGSCANNKRKNFNKKKILENKTNKITDYLMQGTASASMNVRMSAKNFVTSAANGKVCN